MVSQFESFLLCSQLLRPDLYVHAVSVMNRTIPTTYLHFFLFRRLFGREGVGKPESPLELATTMTEAPLARRSCMSSFGMFTKLSRRLAAQKEVLGLS